MSENLNINVDYDNPWLYNQVPFGSDDIEDNFGFVYRITNSRINAVTLGENISGHLENRQVKNEK